jgi:hypothetical protein
MEHLTAAEITQRLDFMNLLFGLLCAHGGAVLWATISFIRNVGKIPKMEKDINYLHEKVRALEAGNAKAMDSSLFKQVS